MKKQLKHVAKVIIGAPAKIAQVPGAILKKPEYPNIPEKTLAGIKQKLEREHKRLEDEIAKIRKYPEYGQSEDENVQELEEFNQNVGLSKNLRTLLAETDEALVKIGKGAYGSCGSCKNAIDLSRLEAFPGAALCITCERDATKKRWWQLWKRR
ncbi:TraR/DksA C4-type zinc finger protein [Candidatus Berkelbacteria bacterium]|nr:TraR/DksA C4-type zinc finger protein [Candidatus Berkelbacteria bacterium]